ncbi:MAG: molybdopterin molybdotransferase MoeA [Chloroflexi bacterium]|nr:molybdopterin molybdotransferase MoeA [Chloroflexota bacterium]MDA1297073.1 molybdopterin molybdotransferase MoeA [Chloroflexota bacterium]
MTQHSHDKAHAAHSDRPHRHHYDADMLSVEEARERILSHFKRLEPVEVDLLDALDMVLAEDLVAPFDVPPLPNSAMDGYAVIAADLAAASSGSPVELPVAFTIAAGALPEGRLMAGSAARIMTGAPMPDGADAVVPFEDTDELERRGRGASGTGADRIGVRLAPAAGDNVRRAGEDIARGELALRSGTVLRPGAIGVAASLGRSSVKAYRRPVVAIVSTGDELLSPGEEHQPGKIYNSNAYSIAAEVRRYGGVPLMAGIARDTIESLQDRLADALKADMVVTSAGVSKGDYDVVKDVLAKNGAIALWSVRMRPAKPLAFGTLNAPDGRKVPLLGLPGNPVSAMVAFEQFGRPAIHVMMGRGELPKPVVQAVLDDPVNNYDGRRVYARVVVYEAEDGTLRARSTGTQSSGALMSMAAANGLAICPDDVAKIEAGETATVEMLDWPEDVFSRRPPPAS